MKSTPEKVIYVPGSCNIGQDEIRRRYRIGFIGLALMIAYILVFKFSDFPKLIKLGLFIPAFYSVSGFVQAFHKFCYVYGWKGVASLTSRRHLIQVDDKTATRKDLHNAIIIVLEVILASLMITLLYYFLPV